MSKLLPVLIAVASLTAPLWCDPLKNDLLGEGLWWLYHARYNKAHEMFDHYVQAHPEDPAGYFYKTATDWWELAQELDYHLPEIEQRFEENYRKTIETAKKVADSTSDKKIKARAYLYLGGAEGLKGRWLVLKKEWIKAYFRGQSGHRYLKQAVSLDP